MIVHVPHHKPGQDAKPDIVLYVVKLLGMVIIIAEVVAALAQLLHLQESAALVNLASTAMGALAGFLVQPNVRDRVNARLPVPKPKPPAADSTPPAPPGDASDAGDDDAKDETAP